MEMQIPTEVLEDATKGVVTLRCKTQNGEPVLILVAVGKNKVQELEEFLQWPLGDL